MCPIQNNKTCKKKKKKNHTFPSLLKYFSRSLEVTLVDNPVTYKLFPGLDASTDSRLLGANTLDLSFELNTFYKAGISNATNSIS